MDSLKLSSRMILTREECIANFGKNDDCYYSVNGRLIQHRDDLNSFGDDVIIRVHPRLRGGKGGFGSMLRAIGNQIEKNSNNDMCRDLSGRRIRDVNAEAKLKEWYEKASEREREKLNKFLEKQKRRREALAKGPLHDHKFNDPEFNRRKEHISAELQDAVEDMLKKIVEESGPAEPSKKRRKIWIETVDGDDLSSSEDDDSEEEDNDIPSPFTEPGPSTSSSNHELNENTEISSLKDEPTEVSEDNCTKDEVTEAQKSISAKVEEQKITDFEKITDEILGTVSSASDLESYGLDSLKQALSSRGLKCGGTLSERARRLFSVRDLDPKDYPVKLLAVKPKN